MLPLECCIPQIEISVSSLHDELRGGAGAAIVRFVLIPAK
jgi:hypothetical protein